MAPRSNLPLLTLDRFEQAMQIARLAAEHDLPELSTRAVNEALRAGPPIVPARSTSASARVVSGRARWDVDEGPVDQVSPRVVANLVELEGVWQKHTMSAEAVYQVAARRGLAAGAAGRGLPVRDAAQRERPAPAPERGARSWPPGP